MNCSNLFFKKPEGAFLNVHDTVTNMLETLVFTVHWTDHGRLPLFELLTHHILKMNQDLIIFLAHFALGVTGCCIDLGLCVLREVLRIALCADSVPAGSYECEETSSLDTIKW